MGNNSYIQELTENFAVRMIILYDALKIKKEYTISKQIVRSGTSIGANFAESQGAQSMADYITKLHISLKESKETEFWLNVLYKAGFITDGEHKSFRKDLNIIIGSLIKILKRCKE